MPSKSHPTAQKRAKERARFEKQQAKAQRRLERKQDRLNRPDEGPSFEIGEPQAPLTDDDEG
jgi:hypothetical protein